MQEMDTTSHGGSGGAGRNGVVRVGMAGVAGYGGSLIADLQRCGRDLPVPVELVAVYEAFPRAAGDRLAELSEAGVVIHESYAELLADPTVEAVWLPVPIHLHRPMTEAALRAGKAVMCEKPAAGGVADLEAMIAARDAAGLPLLIGFQEVYDPATRELKRRLSAGVIGVVDRVSVRACWPRSDAYFSRSNWAGRREIDGVAVHDSPLANALAHFVNLALCFAEVHDLDAAATIDSLDATLYRVNAIENFDTVTLAGTTHAGVTVQAWLTHACRASVDPVIRIEGDAGHVTRTLHDVRICRPGKPDEVLPLIPRDRRPMFTAFAAAVRGLAHPESILATPELARGHTRLVERLSRLPITRPPDDAIVRVPQEDGATLRAWPDIERRFADAQAKGLAPLDLLA
jgi:predicted dehydrogenase